MLGFLGLLNLFMVVKLNMVSILLDRMSMRMLAMIRFMKMGIVKNFV